jgi:SAM-dependent methyltransferase
MKLSDHAAANRDAWTRLSDGFVETCRKCWATSEITWGVWSIPERELRAFGPLEDLAGKDVVELGCGTAYFSAWMARLGAKPVGIDVTPAQLEKARAFQQEFGIRFPLVEGSAEATPFPDAAFDLVFSEYGASIWCDPFAWIPEAARLLRPGGRLVFMRNSTLSILCSPETGEPGNCLVRDFFGLNRIQWPDDGSVEFHLPAGPMLRLLRANGFEIVDLIEVQAGPQDPHSQYEVISHDWALRWPSEEIWVAVKR